MIKDLIAAIKSPNCPIDNLDNWEQFKNSPQLADITDYITK
jgi:hypothetical protein